MIETFTYFLLTWHHQVQVSQQIFAKINLLLIYIMYKKNSPITVICTWRVLIESLVIHKVLVDFGVRPSTLFFLIYKLKSCTFRWIKIILHIFALFRKNEKTNSRYLKFISTSRNIHTYLNNFYMNFSIRFFNIQICFS